MSAEVPEKYRHLLDAPVAALATNGPDGRPQVTAVSFIHDKADDVIRISLNDTRQKTRNLRRDPRATLFIYDPATEFITLEIRADAELSPDADFAFASNAAKPKYGPDTDFHDHDQPGETRSIVTLRPVKVNVTDLT